MIKKYIKKPVIIEAIQFKDNAYQLFTSLWGKKPQGLTMKIELIPM